MATYTFSNICGAVFEGGRIRFSKDDNAILVPTSNRLTVYDLRQNRSQTLPFEAQENIQHVVYSPLHPLIILIDVSGRSLVVNLVKCVILSRFSFSAKVQDAKFSPCGKYFATVSGKALNIWDSPSLESRWLYSQRHKIQQHADIIVSVAWSPDSNYLCTASRDLTVRIFSRDPIEGFRVISFVEHRSPLRGAFFSQDMTCIVSVSLTGTLISWKYSSNHQDAHQVSDGENHQTETRGFHLQYVPPNSNRSYVGAAVHRRLREEHLSSQDHMTDAAQTLAHSVDFRVGTWSLAHKAFCNQVSGALVCHVAYNAPMSLLAVGFSNGILGLYSSPEFSALYTLSVGSAPLDSLDLTKDGEWLAIGSSYCGQVVVWEWKSETYILKQQAHSTGIRCVACCPTLDKFTQTRLGGEKNVVTVLGLGHRSIPVATGGEDGKLKIWDAISGYNYMTFTDHTAPINDVVFTPQGNAVISASDDGKVCAFDLIRYRKFRTFTANTDTTQFSCVAIDMSGEVVVAGTRGSEYMVYVWSLQTGKQLECLSGHEECISAVAFNPHPAQCGILVSASWDRHLRVWDIFGRVKKGGEAEVLAHSSEVLCAVFDPRGNNQLAVSTLCGNIWFWNLQDSVMLGYIDALRDIQSGRRVTDAFSANNTRALSKKASRFPGQGVRQNQHFSTLVYSSNGIWLLAAAKTSPRVCIYSTETRELLYGVQVTHNRSLDGLVMELNSKWMLESGVAVQQVDGSDSEEDEVTRRETRIKQHYSLPGVEVGELKGFHTRREFKLWKITFSQDGQQWCVATSHGLFTFSLDSKGCTSLMTRHLGHHGISFSHQLDTFRPNLLTKAVSPQAIQSAMKSHPAQAMVLALALNDFSWLTRVYCSISYAMIPVVVQSIPPLLLPALLNFLRICLSEGKDYMNDFNEDSTEVNTMHYVGSPHIEYHMQWLTHLLSCHLSVLQHVKPNESSDAQQSEGFHGNLRLNMMAELGVGQNDLLSICLLLLRNVQRVQSHLGMLFSFNFRTLDALLMLNY